MKHFINDLRKLYRIWKLMRNNYYVMTFDNGIIGEVFYKVESRKHFKRLIAITRKKCVFS